MVKGTKVLSIICEWVSKPVSMNGGYMKVTCISCHKKFDNDKYYGICPKCGAFNKLHLGVDEHERYHQMYDDDKNAHSEQAVHEQYHEKYDNTTSHAKVSTAGMDGSSLYAEELNKKRDVRVSVKEDSVQREKRKSNVTLAKWIALFIVLANLLPYFWNLFKHLFE